MAQQPPNIEILQDSVIVDTDVHLSRGILPEEVAEHLVEPYRGNVLSPYTRGGSFWDPYMGGKIENKRIDNPKDIDETLVQEFQIDYPLLNPLAGIAKHPQPDYATEVMKARNNVMIEKFLDPSDHLGLALIDFHEPDKAAEEIDRLSKEKQVVGCFVESTGSMYPLGTPKYDIIYQAAEDNEMHVAYHGAAANNFKADFPKQNQGLSQFLSVHTLAHPWSAMLTLTSLIVQGTPEKFPNLNFSFLEAGIGWAPYMMWRLNKEYAIRRSEAPLLTKSPEEYIKDQFYFATQPIGEPNNPTHMRDMIELVGMDSVMFASDYPHWDFDHPSALAKYLQTMYSEEEQEKLLKNNPAEAFNLNI